MTAEQLAACAAPILWFSPDEPLLKAGPRRLKGTDIAIPTPFPFEEESAQPVVYFRLRRILQRLDEPGEALVPAGPSAVLPVPITRLCERSRNSMPTRVP